jgi:hypothetical protein
MSSKPRLDRLRALAEANRQLQQFGQSNDDEVHNGETACTHTVCQFLSLVWNGRIPTLNEVNRKAGMPANARNSEGKKRGMRPEELERYFDAEKIPMKIRFGLPYGTLLEASDDAPVFYAMRYGSAPKASASHPNGTTQTSPKDVVDIRHAVVMLGFLNIPASGAKPARVEIYRKEPNHGSPARPERPPYDTISDRQGRIEYEAYKTKLGNPLYAALPTKPLPVIGTFSTPAVPVTPLTVTELKPFSGTATIRGDNHFAVQIADRQFIPLADGVQKRVFATGRLMPRLPGPPGDRENVVVIGDEAAVLLRVDIVLRDDAGVEVPREGLTRSPDEDLAPPKRGTIELPEGIPVNASDDPDRFSNGAIPGE